MFLFKPWTVATGSRPTQPRCVPSFSATPQTCWWYLVTEPAPRPGIPGHAWRQPPHLDAYTPRLTPQNPALDALHHFGTDLAKTLSVFVSTP